jgi:hypothetical protein
VTETRDTVATASAERELGRYRRLQERRRSRDRRSSFVLLTTEIEL